MFRVSKVDERSRTVITIDGQLSGDYIEAVETCCDQAISTGKPVHLSLRDVSTIDQGGSAWNPMVSDVHHTTILPPDEEHSSESDTACDTDPHRHHECGQL